MYEAFYGLHERPFSANPDPRFLLLTSRYREALTQIEYGITERQPITLLLGPLGTGKTTLLRAAVEKSRAAGRMVVWMGNPALSRGEWYEWLAEGFGLTSAAAGSKTRCLVELHDLLLNRLACGLGSTLVVDEAQTLSPELLEEVRLLANIETSTTKLLPIVLGATPELGDRLRMAQHEGLKHRVTVRCSLAPLDLGETAAYVEGRIHIAGGSGVRVFTAGAVRAIHARSGGIPRVISLVCENALITGFALRQQPIEEAVVAEVCADFDLPGTAPSARVAMSASVFESVPIAPPAQAVRLRMELAPSRRPLFDLAADTRKLLSWPRSIMLGISAYAKRSWFDL